MVCRSRSTYAVFAVFLLNTTSCASKQPVAAHPIAEQRADSRDSEQSSKPATSQELANDSTLYDDEYEARGMPSIQNPWTVNDYQAAMTALVALANEDLSLLPRFHSKRSGSVFRRMVSRENIQIYANKDINWQIRNSSLMALGTFFHPLSSCYLAAMEHHIPVDRELVEIMAFMGLLTATTWENLDEAEPLIYRNDPGLAQRLAGLEETQSGTAKVVRGMITAFQDRQFVRLENHIWFASELVQILPRLIGRLTSADQAEMREQIAQFAASEPEPALRKQLKLLQNALMNPKQPLVPHPPNMSLGSP